MNYNEAQQLLIKTVEKYNILRDKVEPNYMLVTRGDGKKFKNAVYENYEQYIEFTELAELLWNITSLSNFIERNLGNLLSDNTSISFDDFADVLSYQDYDDIFSREYRRKNNEPIDNETIDIKAIWALLEVKLNQLKDILQAQVDIPNTVKAIDYIPQNPDDALSLL